MLIYLKCYITLHWIALHCIILHTYILNTYTWKLRLSNILANLYPPVHLSTILSLSFMSMHGLPQHSKLAIPTFFPLHRSQERLTHFTRWYGMDTVNALKSDQVWTRFRSSRIGPLQPLQTPWRPLLSFPFRSRFCNPLYKPWTDGAECVGLLGKYRGAR